MIRCRRVWASNGVYVILPTEIVNAVIIDECAKGTKTRVPQEIRDVIRNLFSSRPTEPTNETKSELQHIADRICDKIRKDYQCSEHIFNERCSNKFAELHITHS